MSYFLCTDEMEDIFKKKTNNKTDYLSLSKCSANVEIHFVPLSLTLGTGPKSSSLGEAATVLQTKT